MAVQGLAKLNRKLKAIPIAAKKAAREAVVDGAFDIANLQYSLAPYDDGDLRNSIEVTSPGGSIPPYSFPGGSRRAGPEQALITAGNTDVHYAHLVEYGTKAHPQGGKLKGTQHPGTSAQPFFWPGYRAGRKRAQSGIKRSITKAIKAAATAGGTGP